MSEFHKYHDIHKFINMHCIVKFLMWINEHDFRSYNKMFRLNFVLQMIQQSAEEISRLRNSVTCLTVFRSPAIGEECMTHTVKGLLPLKILRLEASFSRFLVFTFSLVACIKLLPYFAIARISRDEKILATSRGEEENFDTHLRTMRFERSRDQWWNVMVAPVSR